MSAKSEVIGGVKQFVDLSSQLLRVIRAIGQGENCAEVPEAIMGKLIETDTMLQKSVVKLRHNQEFQQKIDQLQSKIKSREADVMDLAVQLRSVETLLQGALDDTAACVKAIKQAQNAQRKISVDDLLQYSYKVAYTSGKSHILLPLGPFPSAEVMPYTRLFKELLATKEDSKSMEVAEADARIDSLLGEVPSHYHETAAEDLVDF